MNSFFEILPQLLFVYCLEGLLLVFLVVLGLKLFKTNATTRHAIWFVCLLVLIVLPFSSMFLNGMMKEGNESMQPIRPAQRAPGIVSSASFQAREYAPPLNINAGLSEQIKNSSSNFDQNMPVSISDAPIETPTKSLWFGKTIFYILVLGALLQGFLFVRSLTKLTFLIKRSTPVGDIRRQVLTSASNAMKINPAPKLRESSEVSTPMTAGLFKRWILLPKGFGRGDHKSTSIDQALFQVLVHELAHIRRHDTVTASFQSVVGVFLFWHPAYYFIKNKLVEERELAADDWVVNITQSANANNTAVAQNHCHYASTLINVAETVITNKYPISTVACIGNAKQLQLRVKHLLNKNNIFSVSKTWLSIFVISFSLVAGATAASPLWPNFLLWNKESVALIKEKQTEGMTIEGHANFVGPIQSVEEKRFADSEAEQEIERPKRNEDLQWTSLPVKSGDSLSSMFSELRLNKAKLADFMRNEQAQAMALKLMPGQTLLFGLNDDVGLEQLQWQKTKLEATLFNLEQSDYVDYSLDTKPTVKLHFVKGEIERNLFHTARSVGMKNEVIHELAELFAWDINFAKDIRVDDSFKVLYEELYLNGKYVGAGDILAAEFVNKSKTYHAVRYTDQNGESEYYNQRGENLRSTFLQAPLDYRRVSSGFNPRRLHPVTKTYRAHRGTDYAAAKGTPIWAVGNGVVVESGYSKSNGNFVVLQHGDRYQTKYLHLNKRNVAKGDIVSQKQVIGTVGSTGLATGPHLHYEFLVNGVHKDPHNVIKELPTLNVIAENERENFNRVSAELISQLSINETTVLAEKDIAKEKVAAIEESGIGG